MGQVLTCSCDKAHTDLGLPKSFRILKVVGEENQDATFIIRRKLALGGWVGGGFSAAPPRRPFHCPGGLTASAWLVQIGGFRCEGAREEQEC